MRGRRGLQEGGGGGADGAEGALTRHRGGTERSRAGRREGVAGWMPLPCGEDQRKTLVLRGEAPAAGLGAAGSGGLGAGGRRARRQLGHLDAPLPGGAAAERGECEM